MLEKSKRFLHNVAGGIRRFQLFDSSGMDDTLKRSLYYIIFGAMLSQVMGFITTGPAWTGFLRDVLQADDFALGLIAAMPVAANTIQLLAAYLLQRYKKRRLFVIGGGIIGRFFWIPIALTPYIIPSTMADTRVMMVVFFVVIVSIGNSFLNIGFSSLIADLVPMRARGKYFSARHGASLFAGVAGSLAASFIVDRMGMPGYTVVLVIAGVFGMLDLCCFFRVEFPPMHGEGEEQRDPFLRMLLDVFRDRSFMRVVLCFTGWSFAVNISAPFFNVFMLETLGMTYTNITLMNQIAQNICSMLIVRSWGAPLDRFGSKAVVQIAGRICMLTPFLWLFATPQRTWLILAASILNGVFWPAVDLGQQNAYLGAAPEKNRAMYLAVFFAVINLVGVSAGNAIGGALVQSVFTPMAESGFGLFGITWTKYHYVFLLTAVLRVLVMVFLMRALREPEGIHYRKARSTMMSELRDRLLGIHIMLHRNSLRRRFRAGKLEGETDIPHTEDGSDEEDLHGKE